MADSWLLKTILLGFRTQNGRRFPIWRDHNNSAEYETEGGINEFAQAAPTGIALAEPQFDAPVRKRRSTTIASLLVNNGMIAPEIMAKAQEAAQKDRLPLWMVMTRDGLVSSNDLAALFALHLGVRMVDLRNQEIDREAVNLLPEHTARKYHVLPLDLTDGQLTVAMVDPTDLQILQDIAARTQCVINPVVCRPEDIREHIDISYRLIEADGEGKDGATSSGRGRITATSLRESSPSQIVDLLVQQAVHDRASDIHITPEETRLRVRFRIDGILHDMLTLPISLHPAVISRLKITAGLNIAERRRPQDGQFSVDLQGRKVDVRLAISSTVTGEMAVMRLLDKSGFTLLGLNDLGMDTNLLDQYRGLLQRPYGMIIVCGPTGSGKSTTLYASLLQMDRVERNLITLEDPVEYRLNETSQMQVHPEAGVTFATQLRSILRLDPDVLLIGEIRDQETATIATQAALTGHLVLTTLHANDSVAALVRMRDLGVPSYLVASSVIGIVAQRMVRVTCKECQVVMQRPVAEQQAYFSETGQQREMFLYGEGCNICAHTGYRGRSGVYEVLTFSDGLRQLFLDEAPDPPFHSKRAKRDSSPCGRQGCTA